MKILQTTDRKLSFLRKSLFALNESHTAFSYANNARMREDVLTGTLATMKVIKFTFVRYP